MCKTAIHVFVVLRESNICCHGVQNFNGIKITLESIAEVL